MSDDEIDPEIAAAMGFTSFGSKRRKITPRNDYAVVGGLEDGSMGVDGFTGGNAYTGANEVVLGVRGGNAGSSREVLERENNMVGQNVVEVGEAQVWVREVGDVQHGGSAQEKNTSTVEKTLGQTVGQVVEQAQEVQTQTQAQEMKRWTQGWPSAEELAALRRGVRNSRGDMVVFLPGFVDDPWKGLR